MYVVEQKVEWSINSSTFQWYILYMYNIIHRKKSKYIEIRKSWHKYGLILLLLKCFFKIISAHFFKAFRKSFSCFSGKSSSQIVLYLYLLLFFFHILGNLVLWIENISLSVYVQSSLTNAVVFCKQVVHSVQRLLYLVCNTKQDIYVSKKPFKNIIYY